jgi:hypothetical protein
MSRNPFSVSPCHHLPTFRTSLWRGALHLHRRQQSSVEASWYLIVRGNDERNLGVTILPLLSSPITALTRVFSVIWLTLISALLPFLPTLITLLPTAPTLYANILRSPPLPFFLNSILNEFRKLTAVSQVTPLLKYYPQRLQPLHNFNRSSISVLWYLLLAPCMQLDSISITNKLHFCGDLTHYLIFDCFQSFKSYHLFHKFYVSRILCFVTTFTAV